MMDSLSVQGLTKKFAGFTAVDNVTFSVRGGEIVGFVGPNGAGKTTTMKMIAGLLQPTAGSVVVAGQRLCDHPQPGRMVGFAIEPRAFHRGRSVRNTLRLTARLTGMPLAAADEAMELVGLASVAKRPAGALSTGMLQRLTTAHCMLPKPRFMVFDEPLNGLDVAGVEWLNDTLRWLRDQQVGILLSSHLLSELENIADRAVILNNGQLVHDGAMTITADVSSSTVSSSDNVALQTACVAAGFEASHQSGSDQLIVLATCREVFRVAVQAGVELDTLAPSKSKDLRTIFRDLTTSQYTPESGQRGGQPDQPGSADTGVSLPGSNTAPSSTRP